LLTEAQKNKVYAEIANLVARAALEYPVYEVKFEDMGRVGGRFYSPLATDSSKCMTLAFNQTLITDNFDEYFLRTIPHEVAHMVDFVRLGYKHRTKRRGGKLVRDSHGVDFQTIMLELGAFSNKVYDSKRCHSYDTSKLKPKKKRVYRKFAYTCSPGCLGTHKTWADADGKGQWELTTIRHNKLLRGKVKRYWCPQCEATLKFAGEIK